MSEQNNKSSPSRRRATSELKRDSALEGRKFAKVFSEKFQDELSKTNYSLKEFAEFLSDKEPEITRDTIKSYARENPPTPSIYAASTISKALNFSLDEMRDAYFDIKPTGETVHGKLLEYYRLYSSIIKVFPQLSNYEYYNDVPCFVEFLKKIEGINDMELIKTIVQTFDERYFIRDTLMLNKHDFIEELKKYYISDNIRGYYPNNGKDKKIMIEKSFYKLCEEYTDLNKLYNKIHEFDAFKPIHSNN